MLDDSPEKFTPSSRRNVVVIPTFTVLDPQADPRRDQELLKVMYYLSSISSDNVSDVRDQIQNVPY